MKPIQLLLSLTVLFLNPLFAADLPGTPEQSARYGEPIRLRYQPVNGADVNGVEAEVASNPGAPSARIVLVQSDGIWERAYMVSDTAVRALKVEWKVSDDQGNPVAIADSVAWILMTGQDGRPVRGAHERLALFRLESPGSAVNLLEAESDIRGELELYPENFSCRMLLYTVWMRRAKGKSPAVERIKRDVDSVLTAGGENPETLGFAAEALRRIGEKDESDRMTVRLIRIDPRGPAAVSAGLDSILALKDPADRIIRIEKWLKTAPNTPLVWRAWEGLAASAIGVGDSVRMTTAADTLIRSPLAQSAGTLAALAGAFSEKRSHLDRALVCARRSLELFDAADSTQPPPGVASDDWTEERRLTRARYEGTLGWILLMTGDTESAIRSLEYSAGALLEPGVFSRLAQAYERAGTPDRALVYYARTAAFGGDGGEAARQSFNALWTKLGLNAEDMRRMMSEQADWVNAAYRERVLGRETVKSSPNLNLKDLGGRRVRLSEQQGVVVLCFWATWSGSSGKMLDELQALAETHGDVLFLTVALDRQSGGVSKFIKSRRIGLPVLLDDGSSDRFGLEGVPTVLVLDAGHSIRFEHRGYRPDIRNLLSTEIESLTAKGTH